MSVADSPLSPPQRAWVVLGSDGATFSIPVYQWLVELKTKVDAAFVAVAGQATLIAGIAVVAAGGITTANLAFVSLAAGAGTLGQYQGVCTSGTLTITSLQSNNTTQTADTSTVNYVIYSLGS